jgi:hypothetical protein
LGSQNCRDKAMVIHWEEREHVEPRGSQKHSEY